MIIINYMVQLGQDGHDCLDCEQYEQLLAALDTCASLQKTNLVWEAKFKLVDQKLLAVQRTRLEVQNKLEVAQSSLMLVMEVFRKTNTALERLTSSSRREKEESLELAKPVQKQEVVIGSSVGQVEALNGIIADLTQRLKETTVELRKECSKRNQVTLQYQDLQSRQMERQLSRTLQIKVVDYQEMVRKLGEYSGVKSKECTGKQYFGVAPKDSENRVYSLLNKFCELADEEQTRINSLQNQKSALISENKKHRTMINDYKKSIANYFVQMSNNQVTIRELTSEIQQLKSLPREIYPKPYQDPETEFDYCGSSQAPSSSPLRTKVQTTHCEFPRHVRPAFDPKDCMSYQGSTIQQDAPSIYTQQLTCGSVPVLKSLYEDMQRQIRLAGQSMLECQHMLE